MKRTTKVNEMSTNSILNGSVFNIGDAHLVKPISKVIALQKEGAPFQGDIQFRDFSIFHRKAIMPTTKPNLIKKTIHHDPYIHVNCTSITGISTSSQVHVGNVSQISAESRVKHIRILMDE